MKYWTWFTFGMVKITKNSIFFTHNLIFILFFYCILWFLTESIGIGRISRATECLNATVVGISGQWPVVYLAFQEVAYPHPKSHKSWLTRVLSLNG